MVELIRPSRRGFLSRRGLLAGLGLVIAAPAVIRMAKLMPVSVLPIRVQRAFSQKDLSYATYSRDGNILVGGNLVTPKELEEVLKIPVEGILMERREYKRISIYRSLSEGPNWMIREGDEIPREMEQV
jgi:hypothetical protein